MHRLFALVLALLVALPAGAAVPIPPPDDNGQQSFVRQIVPKLLGRRPKGTLEVQLLADLADLVGRESVVRALMETPEFRDHWTAQLIDHLKVDREFGLAQAESCYGGPMPFSGGSLAEGSSPSSTASYVRDAGLQSSYHREFNMYELIQDAIRDDGLFPIYRAHLFALGDKVNAGNSMISNAEQRAIVGSTFDDVFLNRDLECMTCHNSEFAVTDYADRHHPAFRELDPPLFAADGGPPAEIPLPLYQSQCVSCHGANGTGGVYPVNVRDKTEQDIQDAIDAAGSPMGSLSLSGDELASLEAALVDGGPFSAGAIGQTAARHFGMFRRDFFRPLRFCEDGTTACTGDGACEGIGDGSCQSEEVGWGPWGISTDCAAIWDEEREGPIPAFFAGLTTSYGTVADIDASLRNGYEALPGAPEITGDTAFAYMLAAKITENVWRQLMGEPLTLVNRYARNREQKDTHRYLTEDVFIEHDWSLKELIVAILAERFFNRRAPSGSTASRAYALPPMWDPFVPETDACDARREEREIDAYVFRDASGRSGGGTALPAGELVLHSNERCAFNGQGDLVHRYSPRTLMSATSRALDWPEPEIFPASQGYLDRGFQRSIGQYLSAIDPGTPTVDFQALLYWDDEHGLCSVDGDGDPETEDPIPDWIDDLLAEIDAENGAAACEPVTLADAVATLKDWILQEPTIAGRERSDGISAADDYASGPVPPPTLSLTEEEALEELFGQSLDDPVTTDDAFEASLRELCGSFLRSPQFLLAAIVRPDDFQSPRMRVCNDGPCTYVEMCRVYEKILEDEMGYSLDCRIDGVQEPLPLAFGGRGDPDPPEDELDLTKSPGDPDPADQACPVPEPGFGLALMAGALFAGCLRRRRGQRAFGRVSRGA